MGRERGGNAVRPAPFPFVVKPLPRIGRFHEQVFAAPGGIADDGNGRDHAVILQAFRPRVDLRQHGGGREDAGLARAIVTGFDRQVVERVKPVIQNVAGFQIRVVARLFQVVQIGSVGLLLHPPAAEAFNAHQRHGDFAFHLGKERAGVAGEGPAAVAPVAHTHIGIQFLLRIGEVDGGRTGCSIGPERCH